MVSQSAQNIRHKLKNYLMGIKAFTDLIRIDLKKNKASSVSEYLEKIDKKIDEANEYINKEVV